MSQQERRQQMMQNHACFSCLKKAGRDHRAATCRRRRPCTERTWGVPCHSFHHSLLHAPSDRKEIGIACVSNMNNFLPVLKAKMGDAQQRNYRKRAVGQWCSDQLGAQISLVRDEVAKTLNLK